MRKISSTHDADCCSRRRYTKSLEPFYDSFDPQFLEVRRVVREVLQKEADLQEIVQLVGKARAPAILSRHPRNTCNLGLSQILQMIIRAASLARKAVEIHLEYIIVVRCDKCSAGASWTALCCQMHDTMYSAQRVITSNGCVSCFSHGSDYTAADPVLARRG